MNGLDVAIGLAALASFVGGYRAGLLARVASWVGTILGLLLAAANLGPLTDRFSSGETRRPGVVVAVLLGGTIAGRIVGDVFGRWVQSRLPTKPVRTANRLAGGALGVLGVVATVWLVTPLLAFVPGWPAGAARSSALATTIANRAPARIDVVASVRRLLAAGRLPDVVAQLQPSLSAAPPADVALDPSTLARVERSTYRIEAVGCGGESLGTGFAIGSHRIVTNAHVVAGATAVAFGDGADVLHPATVVAFDPSRDLAVLDTATALVPLSLDEAGGDGALAVFGHPGGGPLRVAPASVQERITAMGRDIYDDRSASRAVLVLAAALHPGDSGAPVVTTDGRVAGVAFAIAPDVPSTAYALQVSELRGLLDTVAAAGKASAIAVGRCLR